jgi:hypothetical protein
MTGDPPSATSKETIEPKAGPARNGNPWGRI